MEKRGEVVLIVVQQVTLPITLSKIKVSEKDYMEYFFFTFALPLIGQRLGYNSQAVTLFAPFFRLKKC